MGDQKDCQTKIDSLHVTLGRALDFQMKETDRLLREREEFEERLEELEAAKRKAAGPPQGRAAKKGGGS